MQPTNKVVSLTDFKRQSTQELIDDIGARAFLFLRNAADELGLPIKDVIVEHMLGLSLVMAAVEGKQEAGKVLDDISKQLHLDH